MMTEISLNVLDVAQNSVKAKADLIKISVLADSYENKLIIEIDDNGCGMTEEQVSQVCDPFFTTRTTRKVGLGVPFFKEAAESTDGSFEIKSTVGVGTKVTAIFTLDHIDRMPLGDMSSTMHNLITLNKHIDFIYSYTVNDESFTLDTRELREILGDVPFDVPEVSAYIMDFLKSNKSEVDKDLII